MSSESLTVILAVGLIAGWLAGQIVHGTGYGIINDLIIGVVGSFIGGWLLPQLGIHLGAGIITAVINATIGAVLLLFVLRLVRGYHQRLRIGRARPRIVEMLCGLRGNSKLVASGAAVLLPVS
jgi:uncharacterized membrane protein YeaQ/YmgE (transglycosylase-associated protein family)